VARVISTGRLPVVTGGINRYIETLVEGDGAAFRHAHDVLFLWVDATQELHEWYTVLCVDDMVARVAFYAGSADCTRGARRAIGLPEIHTYLLTECNGGEAELAEMLVCAVHEIKDQSCQGQHLHPGPDLGGEDRSPQHPRGMGCSPR
jgi:adenylate dimethylallyltransferase (cytokinin synthase)